MKENFFMVAKKANMRKLLDFIKENGHKDTCPDCNQQLTEKSFEQLTCPKCKKNFLMLKKTKIIGLFIYQTGSSKRTVEDYLTELQDAGKLEYVAEKDTFRVI